jgi:hypothetical protein
MRAGKIQVVAGAVLAAGVVTGGMLAVGQGLTVEDNPGKPLGLEGVETGVAAQDASLISGARIKADGSTPKVEEPVVVESPVVDEVPPSGPVVISPRRSGPGPSAPAPAAPAPAPSPKHDGKFDGHWGDHKWDPPKAPEPRHEAPKPPRHDGPRDRSGGGHGGGGHGGH